MRVWTEEEKQQLLEIRKSIKAQNNFKKRVNLAKQRMKNGYWQQLEKERDTFLEKEGDTPENRMRIRNIQYSRFMRENCECCEEEKMSERERLYMRVCVMLDNDEDVTNPIGQLIDYEKYEQMDESARGRYVLNLAKEYNELKERYYQERAIKTS